jgi:hypothetical protein
MAIIPELENKITKKLCWSEDEIDTLKRYYPTIAERDLIPYLNNRSVGSIRVKAHELGLSKRRKFDAS